MLEDGRCLRDQALEVCGLAGAQEVPEVHASSLATIVQMVISGQGITQMTASAITVEARNRKGLVLLEFLPPAPSRSLGLVWRRGARTRPSRDRHPVPRGDRTPHRRRVLRLTHPEHEESM